MIRAIIWKEWKRSWKLLLVFVIASVALPAWPTAFYSNEGQTARAFLYFIWFTFSLLIGFRYEKRENGTLPFLSARPATRPFFFISHTASYLTMIAILVFVSFLFHYLHLSHSFRDVSLVDMLLDENLLFALVFCVPTFALAAFISSSVLTFGFTRIGLSFIVFVVIVFIFRSHLAPIISLFRKDVKEMPILFLTSSISVSALFAAISVWEVSFDEIRDRKNRRWVFVALFTSLSAILLSINAGNLLGRSMVDFRRMAFEEVRATEVPRYPILATLSGNEHDVAVAIKKDSLYMRDGKFVGLSRLNPVSRIVLPISGKNYSMMYYPPAKWSAFVFYLSNKPLLGDRIRLHQVKHISTHDVSPGHLLSKQKLSAPFLSTDKDRIAYLLSDPSSPGQPAQYLYIVKIESYPLVEHVDHYELPQSQKTYEPIGWTPDGYNFLLRKKGKEQEIWAVNWTATGASLILPGFGDAVITEHDLPEAGEWMSLLMSEQNAHVLWLVNYRSGEELRLGKFSEIPHRAWSDSGEWFAFWSRETGLRIYQVSDTVLPHAEYPEVSSLENMKWSPNGALLALVSPNSAPARGFHLRLLNNTNGTFTTLAEDFPSAEKKWDWLSPAAIVYADGKELRQVDISGEKLFLLSTELLQK